MPAVKKAMSKNPITIASHVPVSKAEALMLEKRIRHLPVTDEQGDIIGLLSQRDLLPVQDRDGLSVGELMSTPVHWVHEDTPLRIAIYKMLERKISCLLISDGSDEAVGIITTDDCLWYLTHLLDEEEAHHRTLRSLFDFQGAGRVTQQLSDMGI